jgi:uncharacterized protein
MNTLFKALDIRTLLRKEDMTPTLILILSALVLSIDRYFGSIEFAGRLLSTGRGIEASLFMFAALFLLLGALPLMVILFVFREHPRAYGIQLGDWRLGIKLTLVLFPLIAAALLLPASQTKEMREFYPLAREAAVSPVGFLVLQIPRVLLFYTAWEFFFRGFMLFGLRRHVGSWLAVCIQTVPQCLWHIGMPTGEIMSSIAGGMLFGIMAVRTNSIVWPLVLHSLIGITLDAFIVATL